MKIQPKENPAPVEDPDDDEFDDDEIDDDEFEDEDDDEVCPTCSGTGEDPVGMPGEPCPDCDDEDDEEEEGD